MKTIAAIILMLSMGFNSIEEIQDNSVIYPATATVISLNYENDIVTVQDANGNIFSFYGCEDYEEHDMVSLIFSDNGTTDTILDDIIVDARYSGYQIHE